MDGLTGWPMSEFLTIIGMIGASFWVIYTEIRAIRRESKDDFERLQRLIREDFENVRSQRKSELDQTKIELKQEMQDIKQTLKSDLFGHRADLKNDIVEISHESKHEINGLRHDIMELTERVIIIDTTIAYLRDDHPLGYPPPYHPPRTEPSD